MTDAADAKKRDIRRAQILDGLFTAMATAGTRGSSITEIATSAGIARGALHYYFSSKEEIRLCLMRRLGDRYIDGLTAYLDRIHGARAPERMAQALVRFHFGGDDAVTERLLSVWIDFWGAAPTDRELNSVVLDVQERARGQCWRVIESLRPDLKDDDDVKRRARAAALLALIEGGLLQWRIASASTTPLDKAALQAALVDSAHSLVLHAPTRSRGHVSNLRGESAHDARE